jgi:hypothetical protein
MKQSNSHRDLRSRKWKNSQSLGVIISNGRIVHDTMSGLVSVVI